MIIKFVPEDFYVKEILDFSNKNPGEEYTYFIMWKKNLTTIKAIKIIARKLGISWRRISFAGEKDKHAITEQFISIKDLKDFEETYDFGNIKLVYIGSFSEPVSTKDIIGNEFKIKVREVTEEEYELFNENIKLFSNYFVNYFDDQRFGKKRPVNHLIGRHIIKRDFETAVKYLLTYTTPEENPKSSNFRDWLRNNWGDWNTALLNIPKWLDIERRVLESLSKHNDYYKALKSLHPRIIKLFIHAYQSYLWNNIVNIIISEECQEKREIKISIGDYFTFGDEDCISEFRDISIPIIGYETNITEYEYSEIIRRVLKTENIEPSEFLFEESPSLSYKGDERKILSEVNKLVYSVDGDTITLKFILKKGSYATMYIKHLFSKKVLS